VFEIRDLKVDRGAQPVLHGVNIEVGPGETVAMLGPNGAGKTTLLRTISGLNPSRSGTIRFNGTDLTRAQPRTVVQAGIVHVPEGRLVFPKLTVRENLELGCFTRKPSETDGAVKQILDRFPILRQRQEQPAGTLSGGEQQMMVIGRALVARPKLIMLDEPSLGLAPKIVAEVARIVEEIRAAGTAVLLVEQEISLAMELSSRVYVLSAGAVVMSGSAAQLRGRQEVMDAYLGLEAR
jgi:branched-chain amino acid transport system ATP-binding protein